MTARRSVFTGVVVGLVVGLTVVPPAAAQPVAPPAVGSSQMLAPAADRGVQPDFLHTLVAAVSVVGDSEQAEPRRDSSDWDLRYNRAVEKRRGVRMRSWIGVGVGSAGLAMEMAGLLTPRTEEECTWYACVEVKRTNKRLVAGGLFTVAAMPLVMASGARAGVEAGAELAILEGERLQAARASDPPAAAGTVTADQWQNVSGLQAGQFVSIEKVKGQGRGASGWVVQGNERELLMHDGDKMLTIDRSAIRRVRAFPRGKEHYGTWGWAVGTAGLLGTLGAMTLMQDQHGWTEDITGTQAAGIGAAMGASVVSFVLISRKGRTETIFDVDKPVESRRQSPSAAGGTGARVQAVAERLAQGVALTMPAKGVGVACTVTW